jgi:hypothetical protein
MGIKYFEQHIMRKYHDGLHRYIQDEMEFLEISSLGMTYRYADKICSNMDLGIPHNKIQEREAPTRRTKDGENKNSLKTTISGHKQIRTLERKRRYREVV